MKTDYKESDITNLRKRDNYDIQNFMTSSRNMKSSWKETKVLNFHLLLQLTIHKVLLLKNQVVIIMDPIISRSRYLLNMSTIIFPKLSLEEQLLFKSI